MTSWPLSLHEIARMPGSASREYRVVFCDAVGERTEIICDVEHTGDISVVVPRPDIFAKGLANPRAVSAAVLAFHRACGD